MVCCSGPLVVVSNLHVALIREDDLPSARIEFGNVVGDRPICSPALCLADEVFSRYHQ
ncbi:Hypothetical protein FKW44_012876 [Caligus rogercresseyi]|uniref:Uncharacterized protein n=1 Tax=Caligus rogercresseyi TaxID=217165 RepID=A0A7T8HL44_CALRO|nr:Hypothetical protein FKW44_012876 [Caligus rogercresseyi]